MQKKINSYKKFSETTKKEREYIIPKDISEFRIVRKGSTERVRMENLAKDSCCAARSNH